MTTQDFLDKIFEEPKTIMGLRNKVSWLNMCHSVLPDYAVYYKLIKNQLESDRKELRTLINSVMQC